MIPAHSIPKSGDLEQDLRRVELWTFRHYLQMSLSLANCAPTRTDLARARVNKAKAAWADALRALDKVLT